MGCQDKKVDIFIVGFAKSGTTTLGHQLSQHSEIHIPDFEPHFFYSPPNFAKGYDYYLKSLCKGANGKTFIGEKTPEYVHRQEAIDEIKKNFPNAKIIFILREPASRAFSEYLHQFKYGREKQSFSKVVKYSLDGVGKPPFRPVIERSNYVDYLKPWYSTFSPEQLFLLTFEEYKSNPQPSLEKIFNFLGVNPSDYVFDNTIKNKTIVPKFPKLVDNVKKVVGEKVFYGIITPTFRNVGVLKQTIKPKPKDMERLKEYYSPKVKELETFLNRKFPEWGYK